MIDAHAHVIPPAWRDTVEPPPSMVAGEVRTAAVLSPWVALLGCPGLNEAMAELGGWVLGSAGSADELRDVMTGPFAGVEITAKVDGEFLGAERFEPFWAAAEETGALVFVHPTTRGFAGPDEHYLWNTVGNPLETTVTAAHMVTAGVLERHPGLKVVLAHAGGAVLWLRGRMRHARAAIAAASSVDVDASLRRLHYDTFTHDPAVLRAVIEFAGATQVLAGSDHPFDMADPDPEATVRAARLPATDEALVLQGNAERLLG
jgi:aminocarboxymuconate-semialdehyde decarboxylase